MKKYLLTIIISLLIGFLLSNFMLKQYDDAVAIMPTFKQEETLYLVQQGVYSSLTSMQENTKNIPYYVYTLDNNLYYVYIGMSLDMDNIEKIRKYYDNMETIVKSKTITDESFINTLKMNDEVLKQTEDKEVIKETINNVLKKYEGS